jgi:hypothetical protein
MLGLCEAHGPKDTRLRVDPGIQTWFWIPGSRLRLAPE